VWTDVDVLVLPTTPFHPTLGQVAADPLTVNDALGRFTNFVNVLDLCAIALPPNLSVVAPAWHDGAAAAVAAELAGETWRPPMASSNEIELAVVGAHLRGQPLHAQLEALGARFVAATTTAPAYRLYALAATTPPKPGMTRVRAGGAAITVEVYALAPAAFGALVASVADPLCIGSVELADGTRVHGFLCENAGLDGATDITRFGGWQRYLASNPLFSS
jgi:allophanate hydrolase